jgi:dihydroorotate dehydrogenase
VGGRLPAAVRAVFGFADGRLEQSLFGGEGRRPLRFRTPVGLAAGFDKNGTRVPFWEALGLGFAEIGSVTARPSAGNPRPRAFRLPDDEALVNRMGLNNDGAGIVAARLSEVSRVAGFPVGVNVAKTHDPSILGDDAIEDFRIGVRAVLAVADYVVLNVSCPNTAEGKTFEEPAALDALLAAVSAVRREAVSTVPLLVKLSPPRPDHDGPVDEIVDVCRRHDVDGLVAVNTASDRAGLVSSPARIARIGAGGLSGRPLAARANSMIRRLHRLTDGKMPLVGVGGIDSAEEAYRRIRAGASLLEVYTGLVYRGPGLVPAIGRGLAERLTNDRLGSISEAVGLDA